MRPNATKTIANNTVEARRRGNRKKRNRAAWQNAAKHERKRVQPKETMRQRKPTNLHVTLERYHEPIVDSPATVKGSWMRTLMPDARGLYLDLGCGKGIFLAEIAQKHPNVLFVGIDHSDVCVARTAQKVVEQELRNVRLICADAADLENIFGEGELDLIYLNFN